MAERNPTKIKSHSSSFGFPDKMEDKESRKKLFLREDKGVYAFEFFKTQYTFAYNLDDEKKNIASNLKPDSPELRKKFDELIENYSDINNWRGCEDYDSHEKGSPIPTIYQLAFFLTESRMEKLRGEEGEKRNYAFVNTAKWQDPNYIKLLDPTSLKPTLKKPQHALPEEASKKETDLLSTVYLAYDKASEFVKNLMPQNTENTPNEVSYKTNSSSLSKAPTETASSQNSNALPSTSSDLLSTVQNKYLGLLSTVQNKYYEVSNFVINLTPQNTPKSEESYDTNSHSISKTSPITTSSQKSNQHRPTANPEIATYSLVLNSVSSVIFGVSNFFQSLINQSQQVNEGTASQEDIGGKTESSKDNAPKDPLNPSVKQASQNEQQPHKKDTNEERIEKAIKKAKTSAEKAERLSAQIRENIHTAKIPPEPPPRQKAKLPDMRTSRIDDRGQVPSPAPRKRERSESPLPDTDWNTPFMNGDRVVTRGHFKNPNNR